MSESGACRESGGIQEGVESVSVVGSESGASRAGASERVGQASKRVCRAGVATESGGSHASDCVGRESCERLCWAGVTSESGGTHARE